VVSLRLLTVAQVVNLRSKDFEVSL